MLICPIAFLPKSLHAWIVGVRFYFNRGRGISKYLTDMLPLIFQRTNDWACKNPNFPMFLPADSKRFGAHSAGTLDMKCSHILTKIYGQLKGVSTSHKVMAYC